MRLGSAVRSIVRARSRRSGCCSCSQTISDFLLAGQKTGGLHRHGQAGAGDDLLAPRAVMPPLDQRIPVTIFLILEVAVSAGISRTGVVADGLEHLTTALPAL